VSARAAYHCWILSVDVRMPGGCGGARATRHDRYRRFCGRDLADPVHRPPDTARAIQVQGHADEVVFRGPGDACTAPASRRTRVSLDTRGRSTAWALRRPNLAPRGTTVAGPARPDKNAALDTTERQRCRTHNCTQHHTCSDLHQVQRSRSPLRKPPLIIEQELRQTIGKPASSAPPQPRQPVNMQEGDRNHVRTDPDVVVRFAISVYRFKIAVCGLTCRSGGSAFGFRLPGGIR
jgi:hypothetical protein